MTVLLSPLSPKGKAKTAVSRLRQALTAWQELIAAAAPAAQRATAFAKVTDAEQVVRALPGEIPRTHSRAQTLREMLAEAHALQASDAGRSG